MRARAAAVLWLSSAGAACHGTGLTDVTGALLFSTPDNPAALTTPDAGLVRIDLGEVVVGATQTLTLDAVCLSGSVVLGALTPVQPDQEFSLPFVSGTTVGSKPTQITVAFSPISIGEKSAVFSLAYSQPASEPLTIVLTGQGVASGLVVSPDPLDFGRVELNQSQSASLTITNKGALPATISVSPLQGANPDLFTLGTPGAAALAPGASTTMTAAFAPLIAENASASFAVAGWSTADPITVSLTGTGVETWLAVTPLLNFNYVQVNHTLVKSAMLTNLSSYATLHLVGTPSVQGLELSLRSYPVAPIAPGQSLPIPVTFSPFALGLTTGLLSLATDDPLAQHPVVPLEGYGGGPEIYCYPRLSFEPTLLGVPQTLPMICLNAGADIPGHPEITLQFSDADSSIDNPVFAAVLAAPGGRPLAADGGLSLAAGASAVIDVTFTPSDAGVLSGKLTVASNDLNDADAGTILIGAGLAPGPCTLQAVPSQLSFGEVPKGDVGKMQLELINVGQDYCLVTGVQIDPKSESAFSLPVGLSSPQTLSFVGNEGFTGGLPTSLLLEVEFAPTATKAVSVGAVDVEAFDTPSLSVSLTGSSLAPCLNIQPPSFDFGVLAWRPASYRGPAILCEPAAAAFTATNTCVQPLSVSQIQLAPGPNADPQFTIGLGDTLPAVLNRGDQLHFVVGFMPDSTGPKLGDILLSSSDLPQTPYLVTVEGDPETKGLRTETFTVRAPPKKVDLAWILDNDDDLTPSIEPLESILPQLIDALDQSQIDYQIAVTSTDTCLGDGSDQGFFEPCDHCFSTAQSNPIFVTPTTAPNPATALGDLFGVFSLPARAECVGLIGDEHLFDTIADAFAPGLLGGHNSGFIRPDAYLAIIMANGDSEDDAANALNGPDGHSPGDYLTTLPEAISLIESLKPDPSQVSFSYIYGGVNNTQGLLPPMMGELVQATGGLWIDSTGPNWQSQLINLFAFGGEAQAVFTLASTPLDPSKVQVTVNGVPTTNWVLSGEQLMLTGTPLPAPGSIVTVTYQEGC